MKPSLVVLFLLLLSFLQHEAQGIRLEKGFMLAGHQKIHEDKSSLIERSNSAALGEVILCKEGHCTGMNRKLTTVTTSTPPPIAATTTKNDENLEEKANQLTPKGRSSDGEIGRKREKFTISSSPTSEHQEVTHEDQFVFIMDYSPAKRKPPIHN